MSTEAAGDLTKARILVIDDDLRTRQMIKWALEKEEFTVETAVDGEQGLERATSTRSTLILLDMHLPVLDGAAVTDRLRAVYGEPPPIILITADDRPEEGTRRVGAVAYLRKPFDLDDLVAMVRRGLQVQSD